MNMPVIEFYNLLTMKYRQSRLLAAFALLLPLVIYLILTWVIFNTAPDWSKNYFGMGNDPVTLTWFLNWWFFAMTHGLNPFVTQYVWFPGGANLTWYTAIPSLSLLTAPIMYFKGPLFVYNLLALSAPALAAWTAFLLARQISNHWLASVIGGYFFGFSSYELAQCLGHLNLACTFLIPLAVFLCVKRVQDDIGQKSFIALLSVTMVLQLGVSTELLATLSFFGAVTWLMFILCGPPSLRPALQTLKRDVEITCLFALFLAMPFLFYLYAALPVLVPDLDASFTYSVDPLNFIVPTVITKLGGAQFAPLSARFLANPGEQGAYLTLPMILCVSLYLHAQWRNRAARALAICLLIFIVFSLGPRLRILDHPALISLPWALFQKVPLLGDALPDRFTLYVALSCAIMVALYLAMPASKWQRLGRYGSAATVAVFMFPNASAYGWVHWPEQAFFTPDNVRHKLGTLPNVLILPFDATGPGMAWQLDAGMSFTQTGGYVGLDPYSERGNAVLHELLFDSPTPNFGNDLKALCATHHVDYVLLGPGTPLDLAAAMNGLAWPQSLDQGVTIIKVPAQKDLVFYQISGDYWPSAAPANWMGHRIHIVTRNSPITLSLSSDGNAPDPSFLSLAGSGQPASYIIHHGQTLNIPIPANADVTLTASQTFIPDKTLHNRDDRALSVLLTVKSP